MSSTKIEFGVQMTCNSCVEAVKKCLINVPDIKNFDINLDNNTVVVETTLSTLDVQSKLETTGRKVVVKGLAGTLAGVAILDTGVHSIKGVVRFMQVTSNSCIVDGTIDGLQPGIEHRLSVHECGDISQGCKSVGSIYNPNNTKTGRLYGDLGTFKVDRTGRADFRLEDNVLKLSDIIGRSLVVSNTDSNEGLVCGIIARSAGLFENPKTICACDGVTIWNEKINSKAAL